MYIYEKSRIYFQSISKIVRIHVRAFQFEKLVFSWKNAQVW